MQLKPEVKALCDEIRRFLASEVDPRALEIEEKDAIPADLHRKACEMGLFGLTIPEQYGGIGLDLAGKCAVEEVMGLTHYGFATLIGNHTGGSRSTVGAGAVQSTTVEGADAGRRPTSSTRTPSPATSPNAATASSPLVADSTSQSVCSIATSNRSNIGSSSIASSRGCCKPMRKTWPVPGRRDTTRRSSTARSLKCAAG